MIGKLQRTIKSKGLTYFLFAAIILLIYITAFIYLNLHQQDFYGIIKAELYSFANSKAYTIRILLDKKFDFVENELYNLVVSEGITKLDTLKLNEQIKRDLTAKFETEIKYDDLGFVVLENKNYEIVLALNNKGLPLGIDTSLIFGVNSNKNSNLWRNELVYSDYNFSIRTPIINYKNKIIGYLRVGIKSNDVFEEIQNLSLLKDKKLSYLLINTHINKIMHSLQNDNLDYNFIKEEAVKDRNLTNQITLKQIKYKGAKDVLIALKKLENSNWLFVFYLDTSQLDDHLRKISNKVFLIVTLSSGLLILILVYFLNYLNKIHLKNVLKNKDEEITLRELKNIVKKSVLDIQLLIDNKGLILAYNNNLQYIFEYKSLPDDTEFYMLLDESEKIKVYNLINQKEFSKKEVIRTVCKKLNGQKFIANLEFQEYKISQNRYFYILLQDITNIAEYEKRIKETERVFLTLLNNLIGMAYRCNIDRDWTMEFVSNGCYELTGYQAEELLYNKFISYNDLILDEYKELIWDLTIKAVNEKTQFSYEYKILTKDKKEKWVREKGIAIYDENGEPKFLEGFIYDITQEKLTEQNLLKSKEKYISIFENSAAGKTILDINGNFIEVNESFCNMLGYTKEEILGKNFSDFTYQEDLIKSKNAFVTLLEHENISLYLVKRYVQKDGKILYAKISSKLIVDDNNTPLFVVTDILDITNEIKIKAELAESEERYKLLAEAAQEGIFLLNRDYKLDFINYYAAKLINQNITPELLLNNQTFNTLFNVPHEIYEKTFIDKKVELVDTTIISNGQKIYLEIKLVPILDEKNKVKEILGIARDETKKRELLNKLNYSTNMMNTIINSVPQGIFWKDKNSRYLGCNLKFAKYTGLSSVEDIIGKTDFELSWKDLAEMYIKDDREVINNNKIQLNKIEDLILANGEKITISTSKASLKNENGDIIGILGIFEDVTDKVRMEEKMKEMIYKLETSNKELEQFAYVASHDLQEPLRMISSYTQLLEQKYKDKLDDTAKQFIYYAVDGAKRMQKLIDDLLEYSRVTTKGKELSSVNLSEVLGKVLISLSTKIHESKAVIINSGLPYVLADESQIFRLLQNLLDNSIKYRSDKQPTIFISAEDMGNKYLIKIKDNGIGIPKEYKEKIFEIFERLHSSSEFPGTGIGLAICKRIVERHGGRIWLDANVTDGAQFCFTLFKGNK